MLEMAISTLKECFDYDPDTGVLVWRTRPIHHFASSNAHAVWNSKHAGHPAGSVNHSGRISTKIWGRLHQNHRIAWAFYFGRWPEDQIDHINGEPMDNRIANLRVVDFTGNARNAKRKHNNTSGVCGVSWHSRDEVWCANIRDGVRQVYLGTFPNREDAIAARKAAELHFGYHPNHGRVVAA